MTKTIVFLMMLMFVLPFDGSAQAVPSSGDRIRIKQVDGTVLTGTLATLSPETIQLSVGLDDRMAEVPVAQIEALEISLGQQSRVGKYIGISMLGGALVGAAIGGITADPGSDSLFPAFDDPGFRMAAGFITGGLIGLPVGFILGSMIREERWNPAAIPAPGESGLTVRPVIGNGVGFVGSVRVGGF